MSEKLIMGIEHNGLACTVEFEESIAITVRLEQHHLEDLDESTARAIVEQHMDKRRQENPHLSEDGWWQFLDTRRLDYQTVQVIYTRTPQIPLPLKPGPYIHITERD